MIRIIDFPVALPPQPTIERDADGRIVAVNCIMGEFDTIHTATGHVQRHEDREFIDTRGIFKPHGGGCE